MAVAAERHLVPSAWQMGSFMVYSGRIRDPSGCVPDQLKATRGR